MDGVVTFLLTRNSERALTFFRDTVGLRFLRDDGFALVFDMDGVMLRINNVKDFTPFVSTVLGWSCADIVARVEELTQRGVAFERYAGIGQDERGIATFPSGDKVAWFKDPDGNVLSLTQFAQ
jgi:catechol 2,3-dioxygenase-like lactoylglutathione lyase family enzyme